MKLLHASPDAIKRRISNLHGYYQLTRLPRHVLLDAAAAVHGFASWAALQASSARPSFVADQDLASDDDYQRHLVEQAISIQRVIAMSVYDAEDLARALRLTSDFQRPERPYYWPNPHINQAASLETGWWWLSRTEADHPLVPQGFKIGIFLNTQDLGRYRLEPARGIHSIEEVPALVPDTLVPSVSHLYCRRDQFLELDSVVWSYVLKSKHTPTAADVDNHRSLLRQVRNLAEFRVAVASARKHHAALVELASDSAAVRRRLRAQLADFPAALRVAHGLPWHWPLVLRLRPGQESLFEALGHYAAEPRPSLRFSYTS